MKIVTIVGARPQFIKAATVSRVISERDDISEIMIHTGQHFDANMSKVFFDELDISQPDFNLGIGGGTHGENTGRMIEGIESALIQEKPDWVIVYGDTDSTLAGTLAAEKLHIPLAHDEAGLRSFNRQMPEEINRVLTDHAANILFVPTIAALKNLENEGISGKSVKLVGDVMYDATLFFRTQARKPIIENLEDKTPFILCTIHRAENTDKSDRLGDILHLINNLAKDVDIVLPLHPRTSAVINQLSKVKLSRDVKVIEPVGFLEMSWLLSHCQMVITDSGGIQKEAYFYEKPCVTLRDETEWVELVEAGFNRLISPENINAHSEIDEMRKLSFSNDGDLYGNGKASKKIIDYIC